MIRIRPTLLSHLYLPLLTVAFAAALSAPTPAAAQAPPGFDPAQMEKMMKRFQDPAAMKKLQALAEEAQRCMEGIDDAEIQALRSRAEQAESEINQLCAEGKESQARKRALEIGREMQGNATVKKLGECSAGMGSMMQDMPWGEVPGLEKPGATGKTDPSDGNICD